MYRFLYNPEDSGPIESQVTFRATAPLPTMAKEAKMLTHDIRLHDHNDLQNILDWLNSKKIFIAGSSRRKIRIYMVEDSPHIREIQSLPEVASIEEYIEPTWHNDVSRQLLGIDDKATNPASNISQTGQGQIIGVADTGIDDQHPDFQNRIIGIEALGRQNDPSDTDGHGTHVAGSILGDGLASDGKLRGMAPGAQLYFQSVMDAHGGLGGLPLDIGDLFKQAYQNGARIHNNSWGAAVDSTYTLNSMEVDEFVAEHRDMLIVISAGNEGTASYVANTSKGIVEWISIGSPASCKNALTVGAHRSNRTEGGLSEFSYGEAWPNDFPDSPISDEKVSGDPESLAGFSSRGPCEETRIKPDIVGPGTDIASCRSKDAPLRHFWGPYPGNKKYAFMGGTSMAAPIVSGCAALVRDYYVNSRNHTPSAALLKATLINGTRWLRGSDATATFSELPNYDQGFGAIYMPLTIPNSSKPKLKLEFLDTWQQPDLQFVNSGDPLRRQISVGSGAPLRFCLVWTDVAGRSLQNDLNLVVENLQTREKWIANKNLPRNIYPLDHSNNIKVIRIENPQPADYYIHLEAFNLLKSPQDCALVITGDLNSQIKPY